MGKKNKSKAALNSSADEPATKKALEEQPPPQTSPAVNEPFEIPLHSKQAAFALLWLLVYSFFMFTLPFVAFYGTKHILADHFDVTGFPNTCGSVLAAVLTVNVIIILYALRGFREAEEDEQERKRNHTTAASGQESKKIK
uniref:(northern house mosquito) hypothetical protein n=1 Tax=Culex pipiens TaxID=7175 RepID=A0A8D8P5L8_CULPI